MKKWTKQEAFDKAYIGVIKQGEISVRPNDSGICAYRSKSSIGKILKCAIGHLILDDEYDPWLDDGFKGGNIIPIITRMNSGNFPVGTKIPEVIQQAFYDKEFEYFLQEIQFAHDNGYKEAFINIFRNKMLKIANKYNLVVPEIT